MQELPDLAYPDLQVPDDTTLSRHARTPEVKLPVLREGEPLHLVVDGTGPKVYREGEWKMRKHGWSRWCKTHLAMDANSSLSPRGRTRPHDGPRSPAVRSHRMKSHPSRSTRPYHH